MKTRDRVLSSLLALSLCAGLASPAALAAEAPEQEAQAAPQAEAVGLTAELLGVDGALAIGGSGRIRLDTTGKDVVVDAIEYSYDTSKLAIDENGVVTRKDGYSSTEAETVEVTVNYTYYSGDSVKYVENFDDAGAKPFSNTNYVINDGQSRTGRYGVTPYGTAGNPATAAVGPFEDVRVTAWYFDPNTAEEQGCTNTMKYGFAATPDAKTPNTNQLGVFFGTGATDGTKTNYAYRTATSGDFASSGLERSAGWHKLEWVITAENGTVMSIDGAQVAAAADRTQVANLTLATNWCSQNSNDQAGMNLLRNRHYIDDISIVSLDAQAESGTATVQVALEPEAPPAPPEPPVLTYGQGGASEVLRKGEDGRVYLDNIDGYAIAEVTYTVDNPNVTVDNAGNLTVKDGYVPAEGETVTVTAAVTYYDKADEIIFSDSFEGEKQFTLPNVYAHSDANPLFGRYALTPQGSATGYPVHEIGEVTDVTVTAWYYDEFADSPAVSGNQLKFGLSINGNGNGMGIFYDGTIAALVGGNTQDHYGMRITGTTYNNYSWGGSNIQRSKGWHKFEWIIDGVNGLTARIDGQVVSTHQGVVGNASAIPELTPVENLAGVKSLKSLNLLEGWNNNSTNLGYIANRHFIDGVTVVKTGASTQTLELTSAAIPVVGVEYSHTPEQPVVDSTYPKALSFDVSPNLDELSKVRLDGEDLTGGQWHVTTRADAPTNASFYPTGRLVVDAGAFKGLADGSHTLTLVMSSGAAHDIAFTAQANTHTPTDYYLSNSGDDSNDGHTAATAWASFDKLSTVTFGPGDRIYLDAASVWSGVQFQPRGSGAEGQPIVITSYNNGGDPSRRPILNGDGTVADRTAHSYLAFEPWRKFYPSGTIELFNVEYWEVRGIEITNYAQSYTQAGVGRNGIAVIHDYFETQGIEKLPSGNQALEEAFYKAGKLQHIVIEDCYIHDVTGYHPGSGGSGAGGKMSGGINVYGPYDGLKLDNNIIMYCDVEGIRNDVLAWRGDTRTQFPCYMEDVSISNNFIVGVPGDGVVISSAVEPKLTHNYLTDAGYSYLVPKAGAFASDGSVQPKAMGNRQDPVIINNSTNFAGLWFIGTMDAVAEYNESVNNVWTCNDGEAFDADMYTWGTVFQYNYTYRNNGGMCLFMSGNQMDDGTVVRYNVSVEDGEGVGTPNDGRKAIFHYNKEPDAIYNNLFILGDNVRGMFGGDSCTAYFYNNMVIKPDGEIGKFNLNTTSNSNAAAKAMTSKTVMNNNLFYPAAILDNVTGSFTRENNITPDTLDGIFVDLDGFMAAQPVKALAGRGDLTGDANNASSGGANVAMSAASGGAVTTPDGTGFDYTQFVGIKTVEGSPTINAGVPVKLTIWPQTDEVHPLTRDFFKNDITGVTTPDIGPYQWSADENHYVKLALEGNGADEQTAPLYAVAGGSVTLPTPVRSGSVFLGWYESADFSGDALTGSYTVSGSGITLYARWEKSGDSCDVLFDTRGGSYVEPQNGLTSGSRVTKPADPTRDGFSFAGWYKDAEGTDPWNFDADTVTADTVIYAVWQALYYTVTFDSNGGDTEAAPGSMQVTLPATTLGTLPAQPTREGYEFLGWNTAADGSGTAFAGDTAVTANVTVYAQWKLTGSYKVTFDSNGGSAVAPEFVAAGGSAGRPDDPARNGYTFGGWYTDAACTDGSEYDFTAAVTADVTLYAKWTEISKPDPDPNPDPDPDPSEPVTPVIPVVPEIVIPAEPGEEIDDGDAPLAELPFIDVDHAKWYAQAVANVVARGLMEGVESLLFAPEDDMTRGMTAKALYALAQKPEITGGASFLDLADGVNYAAAVAWGAETGVIKGYSETEFGGEDVLNRQQLATLLYRYAQLIDGQDVKADVSVLEQFSDHARVSAWAKDAMAWAVANELVVGRTDGTLDPRAVITRAEAAAILDRYSKLFLA